MSFPNMADVSSAQDHFNAPAYAASGRTAIAIKATEGTGYHFAQGDQWTADALAQGLVVVRYHFAGDSEHGTIAAPEHEAAWFLQHAPRRPGLIACVDIEDPLHGPPLYGMTPVEAAAWAGKFLDVCAAVGVDGYPGMGYSMSGSGVIQLLKAPYKRWYAGYPNLVDIPPGSPVDLHQFTDHGPVPGVGNCDDSYCYIDLAVFAGVNPPPPPEEEEMVTLFTHSGGQYIGVKGHWCRPIPTDGLWQFYLRNGVPVQGDGANAEVLDDVFGQMTKLPVAE